MPALHESRSPAAVGSTAIAGMASVAYMDVVIGSLATITLLTALPFVLHGAGGWGAVTHALPASHFQVLGDFSLVQALELFLPTMLLMLGNQSMYQKFFSAKSEKDARNAVVGWIIGTVILETVIVALAVFGSVLFPSGEVHQRPREIIAYTALHGLPRHLGCLAAHHRGGCGTAASACAAADAAPVARRILEAYLAGSI